MLRADSAVLEMPTAMPTLQPVAGVPTRTDIAFTNASGLEKKAIRANTEKQLGKLAPALLRLLAKDEFVVYVAGGCAPMSAIEQYTFGYFAQFVSRVTLVFTNRRILAFRVDTKGDWRESLRACELSDIASAKLSGTILTRYLKLRYSDGKKESYWALKLRDKAKLKTLIPKLLDPGAHSASATPGMRPLCPTCFAPLMAKHYECATCGQKFRDEHSLWWRSLIPGAVYFYARQVGIGVLHGVVDSIITLEVLLTLFLLTSTPSAKRGDQVVGIAVFLMVLLLERSIALWHARRFVREFIPIPNAARSAQALATSAGR